MNFRNWNKNVAGVIEKNAVAPIIFRQISRYGLLSLRLMILSPMRVKNISAVLVWALALAVASTTLAQTNYYTTNGTEYAMVGNMPGDQMFPDAAISPNGGFMVWQDNITDGSGWGISAQQVNNTLSGTLDTFRVNVQGTNDQENPRVALLKNGGAAFVWQGGLEGYQHIFARFLNANDTFLTTTDVLVSKFTNNFQINPAIATLNNSNVVVVWASYDQASSNSMQDVYGQVLSPAGVAIGTNFLINQFTNYNQRTPAIAALTNGGFVVAWVSEQERTLAPNLGANTTYTTASAIVNPSVDIYARLYASNAVAQTSEFLVNTNINPCANPSVAVAADGSFMVAWTERNLANLADDLDVFARTFSSTGVGGTLLRVNTHVYGDQYAPRISVIGGDYLVVWTSLGQDGSREGVFGQFVHENGAPVRGEFRMNTTTLNQQMQPVVASDGVDQFLAVWTSYAGASSGFDLFAQRYINVTSVMDAMSAPFVYAPFTLSNNIYQPQLVVSWPPLLGIAVSNYEVYVDGAGTPMAVTTTNVWTMTAANGLTTNSTHTFELGYVTTAGYQSPLSSSTSGTTWSGLNWGGIPYEWMAAYYGGYADGVYNTSGWPVANTAVGSGVTLLNVFASGGNPQDPSTWLQQALVNTPQGLFLSWNTQPGFTYQVQVTTNLLAWTNLGAPRFAAGSSDSIYMGGSSGAYYRVVLLR